MSLANGETPPLMYCCPQWTERARQMGLLVVSGSRTRKDKLMTGRGPAVMRKVLPLGGAVEVARSYLRMSMACPTCPLRTRPDCHRRARAGVVNSNGRQLKATCRQTRCHKPSKSGDVDQWPFDSWSAPHWTG